MKPSLPQSSVAFMLLVSLALPALAKPSVPWALWRGDTQLSGAVAPTLAPPLRVIWSRNIGATECTAVVSNGVVYISTQMGKVAALRLSNGSVLWQQKFVDAFDASPSVIGNLIVIGDDGGAIRALRLTDGKPVWKVPTGDKIVSCATPGPDGTVLVGSYDNKLYCLNAASGRIKWTFKTDAQVNATAALTKSNMVLISGCDGKLRVLDPTNGIQRAAISLGGNIGASPAVSGSRAFVGTLTGIYAAMNTGTGKLIWKMQEHGDDAQCYASAAVTANAVVFASRSGQVFRIDPKSGRATWSYRAPTAYNSSPVIAGNVIWQGSDDGVLAAIDLATGHKLFSFTAGNAIKGSPALASGRLLIGTTGGTLYCLGK